jgi:hypothetical protein
MHERPPEWFWLVVMNVGVFFLTWLWHYMWVTLPREARKAEKTPRVEDLRLLRRGRRRL